MFLIMGLIDAICIIMLAFGLESMDTALYLTEHKELLEEWTT